MPRYYKPGLADSTVNTDIAPEGNNPAWNIQALKASGYVEGEPPTSSPSPSLSNPATPAGPKTFTDWKADQENATKVDENAIREQVRKENQARIDAINTLYNEMVSQQETVNQDQLGRTRAIAARSGLIGSDFGSSQMDKTVNLGKQAVNAVNAERSQRIAEVLSDISRVGDDRVKAEKEKAIGNLKAYNEYLEKAQTKSKDSISLLGKQGVSVQQLKEKAPDTLKALMDNTGYDEFMIGALLSEADKKENQYSYKVENGMVIGYRTDPQTGQPDIITKAVPGADSGHKVQITPDGSVLVIPNNLDYSKPLDEQIKMYGREGQFVKPATPKSTPNPTKKATNEEAFKIVVGGITSATKQLEDGSTVPWLGQDGFISPEDYTIIRNAWIQDGHDVNYFDSQMKGYRNPNNPYYVVNKTPSKKTTTSSGRSY